VVVHVTVVETYTVQVVRDYDKYSIPMTEWTSPSIARLMAETEENLTDLLPAGYRARIRRWDDFTDEPTQEEDDE
jgi:hypothetical protein